MGSILTNTSMNSCSIVFVAEQSFTPLKRMIASLKRSLISVAANLWDLVTAPNADIERTVPRKERSDHYTY